MSEIKDNLNEEIGEGIPNTVELPKVEELPEIEMPNFEIPKMEETPIPKVEPQLKAESYVAPYVEPQPKVEPYVAQQPKVEPYVEPQPKVEPYVAPQPKVEPYVAPQPKVEPYVESQPKIYDTYRFSQAKPAVEKAVKEPKKKGGAGKKFALCIALALVFGLISGAVFLGVTTLGKHYIGNPSNDYIMQLPENSEPKVEATGEVTKTIQPETVAAGNVAQVAANVMPSIVAISNISVQEVPDFFGSQEFESESSGSGIIVGQNDTELLIATNNHVVVGAKTITVTFDDMSSVEAQIKGTDADNDLAVVAVNINDIESSTLNEIKVATIGDSDKLVVGEQVVAIGNALGYGQSVTAGYVSALDREVTVENVTANLIQTDAAINPGNSGGALLNMQGELIGINAVKFAANGVEGMGYAIPVSTAEPILGELMNRTTRFKVDDEKASYLGVSCRAVTEETAEMYNMPVGVFVAEVVEGAAAQKAGIHKGDIIIKLDGQSIKTYNELVDALQYYEAGEAVDVVISRAEAGEYKEQTVSVTLDVRPTDLDQQSQPGDGNPEGNQDGRGRFQLPW